MRELYFASLLLSAGTCLALALQAAALVAQTRNRQYLRLFFLSVMEALYCALAHQYLNGQGANDVGAHVLTGGPARFDSLARETASFHAWGQGICMLAPFLTYLFGQLCLGVV